MLNNEDIVNINDLPTVKPDNSNSLLLLQTLSDKCPF